MTTIMRRYLLVFHVLLWLCLIQCLRVVFSSLFGVTYDSLFEGATSLSYTVAAGLALLAAFLLPLISGRLERRGILIAGAIALIARVAVSLGEPSLRLWAGLLVIGAAFAALAGSMRQNGRRGLDALAFALLIDQVARALGDTWDISLQEWWWPAQIALTLIGLTIALHLADMQTWGSGRGLTLPGGVALGGILFLQVNLLGLPNALARWSGMDYAWIAPTLFAASLAGAWFGRMRGQHPHRRLALALLLAGGLLAGHFLEGVAGVLALLVAASSSLALLVALPCRSGEPKTSEGITCGNAIFLLLSFGLAFAFTYPYTLSALEGSGIIWYMIAALLGLLAQTRSEPPKTTWRPGPVQVAGLLGASLIVIFALPRSVEAPMEATSLTLATYNVHYGYNTDWHLSLAHQADALKAAGADIVALQEVDTGRITSFSIDDAYWLARRLNMHVVYLPAVERLTGIALLSKYPIQDVGTLLYPSEEEATGLIHARIAVDDAPIDAFATWLGLSKEERERQISAGLEWLALRSPAGPAFFAGDLNSRPDSPTYAHLTDAGFGDAFHILGLGDLPTSPAIEPAGRIDFVRTRELTPLDAGVSASLASDHRMVWVEVALP